MAKRHDGLRRRAPLRQPNPRLLIVCEGTVTEPHYFRDVRHVERSLIDLKIEPGGAPKSLVEKAIELKKASSREARRRADDNLKYEEVWCVFDVDQHPLVPEAKDQAAANGIHLAVSNPCFELWAVLHFQDQRAHIERGKVQHLCRELMTGYEKKLDYEILRPKYPDALKRAEDLEGWHVSRDTTSANPSTTVHKLVQHIRAHISSY